MTDETATAVGYRCWCEKDGCGWERSGSEDSRRLAERATEGLIFGHGIDTGHSKTYRDIGPDSGREDAGDD